MGLKERIQAQKKPPIIPPKNSKRVGDELAAYLQSYLAWLQIQNPSFSSNLSVEELSNYFWHDLRLPESIVRYMKDNPLTILSKTYEYIDRYKDKTSLFTVSVPINPIKIGNYREVKYD